MAAADEVPRFSAAEVPLGVVVYGPEGTFVVGDVGLLSPSAKCMERDLRAIRLAPTSDPIVGTIATITHTIAAAGVSAEVITVGETDYFLVPDASLQHTVSALRRAGHAIRIIDHD